MKRLVIIIIKIYQKILSPLFMPSCRFYPSCSEYSKQAFVKYSFCKAFILSFFRLLKCNSLFPGGFDPVK